MEDQAGWHQLCASLDVLGDTSWAASEFTRLAEYEDLSPGLLYLAVYGVLQAMFAQQDAVGTLRQSVGLNFNPAEIVELSQIREIRNCSVGHATARARGEFRGAFGIIQASLGPHGFTLYSFDVQRRAPADEGAFAEINLLELIEVQSRILVPMIDEARARVADMAAR
jgi:hypothetical protein